METTETIRFPIGRFTIPESISPDLRKEWIRVIAVTPERLRLLVEGMTDQQLDTPYRDGGWTVRQVVHHLVDSHINSYTRFKLALTEDLPTIRPYEEQAWAELPDGKHAPIEVSLPLLDTLHRRWVYCLKSMSEEQWRRKYHHPEIKRDVDLEEALAMYAWHCEHHLAHIRQLKLRMQWE
jgi:hypothetical protein